MVAEVMMGMRLMMGQGVRGRGVVDDVRHGHGGNGGDRVNRVDRVNRMVAAVVGYDHIVVGGTITTHVYELFKYITSSDDIRVIF